MVEIFLSSWQDKHDYVQNVVFDSFRDAKVNLAPQNIKAEFPNHNFIIDYDISLATLYNAKRIKSQSQEFLEGKWDLVIHGLGENNFRISDICKSANLVRPGIIVTVKENCWDDLLNGCFISTVSDYFIIASYIHMLTNIHNKAESINIENKDTPSGMEASFYDKPNFIKNSDMMVELTNGEIIYLD